MSFPNLAGVATANLVESIGSNSFSASYINWSRTMHLLREHAPGWLPELVQSADGGILHRAPGGAFLLLRFVNPDGKATPAVPQAIMDHQNKAIAFDKITARDVTDTHRRGICMAAALTFGLAYELWAKIPLESGYAERHDPEPEQSPEQARKDAHDAALARHAESVAYIKECLADDRIREACEEWAQIPQADQMALWLAPSKGGTLTTEQRKTIKDNGAKYAQKEAA